jgi:hypothetical protein
VTLAEIKADFRAAWEAAVRSGLQQRGTMFLEDLPAGERFILLGTGRRGTVIRVGGSGVIVRYDGKTEVTINDNTFWRPGVPVQIARQTEVLWEALA